MKIGEAYVELKADSTKLRAGMAQAEGMTRKAVSRLGAYAAMAGTAVATMFARAAIREAMAFERQMANVATMLDNVTADLPRMAAGVSRLAQQFGQATETMAKGLYDILSASIDVQQALGVLEISARAAAGGMTTTAVAADAVTSILNAYQMGTAEATRVTDVLFATVKRGKITFNELAGGIGRVAATAATAGISIEEVGAVIATMTRAGIRSREAIIALNGIMMAFIKSSDEARAVAHQFGVDLTAEGLAADGLLGSLQKLSKANLEQLVTIVPNRRAIKGLTALMKQLEGAQDDYRFALESSGQAEAAFIKATDTVDFSTKRAAESFKAAGREVGSVFAPALHLAGGGARAAADGISTMKDAMREFLALEPSSKIAQLRKRLAELGTAGLTKGERVALGVVYERPTPAEEYEEAKKRVVELRQELAPLEEMMGAVFGDLGEQAAWDEMAESGQAFLGRWRDITGEINISLAAMEKFENAQAAANEATRQQLVAAGEIAMRQREAARWVERFKEGLGGAATAMRGLAQRMGATFGLEPAMAGAASAEIGRLQAEGRMAEAATAREMENYRTRINNIAREMAAIGDLTDAEQQGFDAWREAEDRRHAARMTHLEEERIKEVIERDFAWQDEMDQFEEATSKKAEFGYRAASLREIGLAAQGKLGVGGAAAGKGPEEEIAENTKKTVTGVARLAQILEDRTFEARYR